LISSGRTQHAQSVHVTFDRAEDWSERLPEISRAVAHAPTQLDLQGSDRLSPARFVISRASRDQQRSAGDHIGQLNDFQMLDDPIVTSLAPATGLHRVADYKNHASRHHDEIHVSLHDEPKIQT
jgi:peptide-methionine (S)-S-oxide reductase